MTDTYWLQKGKGKGTEEGRESPSSKPGLRYSLLLAPRTPSGLPRSTRPGLRSRAPASAPPPAPNLHRLTLRGSDCPPYSDSGGRADGRAEGSMPGPGAGVWRPGACSTLALGLRPRASSPIPLLVPRAATRGGEKRGQSGQLRPQTSRAGYGGCRGPACPLFPPAAHFRMQDLEGEERPETLSLSSRRDPNRHRNTSTAAESAGVRNLGSPNPKSESPTPPHCSTWTLTWASWDSRRRPQQRGAQTCRRGP